jgi:hypothetical protein
MKAVRQTAGVALGVLGIACMVPSTAGSARGDLILGIVGLVAAAIYSEMNMPSVENAATHLARMRLYPWFSRLSEEPRLTPDIVPTITAANDAHAITVIESRQTDEFMTESLNAMSRELYGRARDRTDARSLHRIWNGWVKHTRAEVVQIAETALTPLATKEAALAQAYRSTLPGMMISCLITTLFEDVLVDMLVYRDVDQLFAAGHMVCGWSGEFPEGSLVVY